MDLNELDEVVNQNKKHNDVSNADVLAALVLIQGQLRTIEKIIIENDKTDQKSIVDIKATLATHDKNISAIPVLTANIISAKVNDVAAEINNSTDNITVAAKALNESNATFKTLIYGWCTSMLLALCIIIYLVW